MPTTAAAIANEVEALGLSADLLGADVEDLSEANALTPELRSGALIVLTKARQMLDDFARSLPALPRPKGKPYAGPQTPNHKVMEAVRKVRATNGRKQ
jgi:hypothetical protein